MCFIQYVAASDSTFAGFNSSTRHEKRNNSVLCSSEPVSCLRSQHQTPNHVSGNTHSTSVINSDTSTIENTRGKKVKTNHTIVNITICNYKYGYGNYLIQNLILYIVAIIVEKSSGSKTIS